MRSLARTKALGVGAVAAVAAALLVALIKLPSASNTDRDAPIAAAGETQAADRSTNGELSMDEASVAARPSPRSRASQDPPVAAERAVVEDPRATIALHGVVRDARTRKPIAGASVKLLASSGNAIEFTGANDDDAIERTAATDLQGEFTFARVAPGTRSLRVDAATYRGEDRRVLMLDGQKKSESSFLLQPEGTLDVSIVYLSGSKDPHRAGDSSRGDEPAMMQLSLVVSRNSLQDTWTDADGRILAVFGRKSRRPPSVPYFQSLGAQLILDEPRPCYLSVCSNREVLASSVVRPSDERVSLGIPAAKGKLPRADARLVVIDATTGSPIARASAALTIESRWSSPIEPADSEGVIIFHDLVCGPRYLTVVASGYEQLNEEVVIEGAQTVNLGVRRLKPAASISGRVIGDEMVREGAGVRALLLSSLDVDAEAGYPTQAVVNEDGSFRIESVAHAKHLLRVESRTWSAPQLVVDASSGPVEDVVIYAAKCADVRFWIEGTFSDSTLSISDARGLPVFEHELGRERALIARLIAGEYTWLITTDGRKAAPHALTVTASGAEVQVTH